MNKLNADALDIAKSDLSVTDKKLALMLDIQQNVPSNAPGQANADYRGSLMSISGLNVGYDKSGMSSVQGGMLAALQAIEKNTDPKNPIPILLPHETESQFFGDSPIPHGGHAPIQ